MEEIKKKPFYRNFNRSEAISFLKHEKLGTFIIRPSSQPQSLAFSQHVLDSRQCSDVYHAQILCVNHAGRVGFCVSQSNEVFDSIEDLLSRLALQFKPILPPSSTTPLRQPSGIFSVTELNLDPEPIGEGSFGVVFSGHLADGRRIAVKQLKSNVPVGSQEHEEFAREAELMRSIDPHPNVVTMFGSTPPPNVFLVLEYVGYGSLYGKLQDRQHYSLSDNELRGLLLKISHGVLHLHVNGIIHRDLAARNIMLASRTVPKIGDLGMARKLANEKSAERTKQNSGPLKWMSPEAIRDQEYSPASDVWSLAVVFGEIIDRLDEPYGELLPVQVAMRVGYEGMRPIAPKNGSTEIANLVFEASEKEPTARIKLPEIIQRLEHANSITLYSQGI